MYKLYILCEYSPIAAICLKVARETFRTNLYQNLRAFAIELNETSELKLHIHMDIQNMYIYDNSYVL